MSDLERRASAFAALADPRRLEIVDLLAVGDLAPSEIATRLKMPSNLVAFHLGVLEQREIVRRSRSEADGRRNYVRLRPEALLTLASEPVAVTGRVVFVCTANSARSQLAAAIWASHSDIPTASAGTKPGAEVNPGALAAAQRIGLTIPTDARPEALAAVYQPGDYLISVCDHAHEGLHGRDDAHWSVPDPAIAGTPAAFDTAATDLRTRIARVAPRLTAA
ncbi:ArsR family transcriptional regulator [Microbacterium sp. CJ88]|uniref:arsenate reductase/protein-tyrosine-phosphatase family protein n=1 Tax=Microbacterium sp. CJ88 TaxID=3445672 RepID=UPI003F65FD78